MSRTKDTAPVRGDASAAEGRVNLPVAETAGGAGHPAAPGDFSMAVHKIIKTAFLRGDAFAPSGAEIGAALGISGKRAGQIVLSLRTRGLVYGEPERCGGIARLRLRNVKPWHCQNTAAPSAGAKKTPEDMLAGIRFEDDPRAIRDMGSRGSIPRSLPTRTWGGVAVYGQ